MFLCLSISFYSQCVSTQFFSSLKVSDFSFYTNKSTSVTCRLISKMASTFAIKKSTELRAAMAVMGFQRGSKKNLTAFSILEQPVALLFRLHGPRVKFRGNERFRYLHFVFHDMLLFSMKIILYFTKQKLAAKCMPLY